MQQQYERTWATDTCIDPTLTAVEVSRCAVLQCLVSHASYGVACTLCAS
jgi:ribosomal protein S27E